MFSFVVIGFVWFFFCKKFKLKKKLVTFFQISKNDGKTNRICILCDKKYFEAYSLRLTTVCSDTILMNQGIMNLPLKDPGSEDEVEYVEQADEDSEEEILGLSNPNDDKKIRILNNIKVDPTDAVDFILMMGQQEKSSNSSTSKTKSLNNQNAFRRHICEVCNKKFMKKSNLIDHLRLHANMKPFQCEHCEKSFVQSGNYKAHLRTHTLERPFVCSYSGCRKSYNQSSALRIHIRTHTNEKNYVCVTCKKRFTNSSDLKKHEGIHDQVKKFQCDRCEKSYAQKSHLVKHEISAHTKTKLKSEKVLK